MRKGILVVTLLAMALALASTAAAAKDEKPMTWKGFITDSICGARNATAEGKECAMQCMKQKGAAWVFVDGASKKVLKIQNQDIVSADKNVGVEVTVTGHVMQNEMLHVDKIAAGTKK